MLFRRLLQISVFAALVTLHTACQSADNGDTGYVDAEEAASATTGESAAVAATDAYVVDVTAVDFAFQAPDEIPSGWTTFRMANAGQQEHFLYLYRLPEDVTYERFLEEAIGPFTEVWEAYASGEIDQAEAGRRFGEQIPAWFFNDMVSVGGPALTEPGETSQATVLLEPGTYVMECYVKTPEGRWHTELGMQRKFTVTDEETGAPMPEADVELTLSNYAIEGSSQLTSGTHTVAVRVTENPEGFMKHDLNLFRLDGETTVDEIVAWMNWMDLEEGFRAPAPGYSLGGVEHLTAGRTGFTTVQLTPGDYAWISEEYGIRGAVLEFTVE
jgi:uncharacterized cupredoxin-like copper-binding protein